MKKVSLDIWIQLIGMLGVLGGLVFVGLVMRQSHTIALATQVQARLEQQLYRNRTWFEGSGNWAIPLQQLLTIN